MSNIYLFFGEEDFLLKEESEALKKQSLDPSNPFGLEQIDGSSVTVDQLVNQISAAPMFGGKRTVIISNLFSDKKKTKAVLAGSDQIIEALKNISSDTLLIFQQSGNIDRRTKLVKFLEKAGTVKEFKAFAFWEQDKIIAWIVGRVKIFKKKIGAHASEMLVEIVGNNLRMLDKELEKLSVFIGDRDTIEVSDVKEVASSGEIDSFALSNSIRRKDLNESLKGLNEIFKDRGSPALIIGMLAKLYRTLLQVKSFERKGMDQYDMAKVLGAKPFFVKKHMENTRLFSLPELKNGLERLHYADKNIKTGGNPRTVLELLVTDLCRAGK